MKKLLLAATAAIAICPLHAVEVKESTDKVSIANDAFKLSYDLKSGTWSATDIASDTAVFSKGRFTVDESGWHKPSGVSRTWKQSEVNDHFGKGRTLTLTETPGGGYAPVKSLHLTVYDKQPFAVLGFSVTNQREFPMRVAEVMPHVKILTFFVDDVGLGC